MGRIREIRQLGQIQLTAQRWRRTKQETERTGRGSELSKQSLLSILLIAGVFHTGCGFGAAPQNAPSKKQDSPCPSIARKLPNLELKEISAEAVAYLKKYSLPVGERTAFCRYLEHIQHDHEVKIEEGLLDMMGDYFLATQKIETGYYFSYKIGFPEREIPQVVLDRASSESEQADLFLKAIDSDSDRARKALLERQIKTLSASTRKEGALKLIRLLLEKSWVFNPAIQKYLESESYHDDSYVFVDRGLRTTSYAHMGATLDSYLNRPGYSSRLVRYQSPCHRALGRPCEVSKPGQTGDVIPG